MSENLADRPEALKKEKLKEWGGKLISGIAESFVENLRAVKGGAEEFFGSEYDGRTGKTRGSAESYLGSVEDQAKRLTNALVPEKCRDWSEVRELLTEIKQVGEGIKIVNGPADVFFAEVMKKFNKMVMEETLEEERRRLAGEILERIEKDGEELAGMAGMVMKKSGTMLETASARTEEYEEWEKGYHLKSNNGDWESLRSFGESLEALTGRIRSNKEQSDGSCGRVGSTTREWVVEWRCFIGEYLPEQKT